MNANDNLHARSATELAAAMQDGTLSATDLVEALLARIDATDGPVHAWAHLDRARVRAEAKLADARPAGARAPLHGLALGVKDIIDTADFPTALGSAVHAGRQPTEDAVAVARWRAAGGLVLGKTVTTEFAFMHPGPTANPWNPRHTPGGSSSGSAAAVALGQVPVAIGTQTNGSVIRPAAYCGVVGFKPTLAAIPFDGVGVFSPTFDTLGIFARSVADVVLAARALMPTMDAATPPARPPRFAYIDGFPWTRGVDCDADDTLDAAATHLRAAGAEVVPVAFPDTLDDVADVQRTIMLCEGAHALAAVQARARALLSPRLNAGLDAGRAIGADAFAAAHAARRAMIATATAWLAGYDALIAPSAPGPAPAGLDTTGDPSCCTFASLAGFPAITLPVGIAGNGLPIGMQLVAIDGADAALLSIAAWCESKLPAWRGLADRP
jgi:Asp-tRNA(Asn)/Glu-tRNA(Gln) amidotransferase A subunit family amidase